VCGGIIRGEIRVLYESGRRRPLERCQSWVSLNSCIRYMKRANSVLIPISSVSRFRSSYKDTTKARGIALAHMALRAFSEAKTLFVRRHVRK